MGYIALLLVGLLAPQARATGVPFPFAPADSLMVDESKELWLLDNHGQTIAAFSTEREAIARTVPLSFEPTWLARIGSKAAVLGVPGGTVALVDMTAGTVAVREALSKSGATGLFGVPVWKPERLLVTYYKHVVELDPVTLKTKQVFRLPGREDNDPSVQWVTPDGSRIIGGPTDLTVFSLEQPPRLLAAHRNHPVPDAFRSDSTGQIYFQPVQSREDPPQFGPNHGGARSFQTGLRISDENFEDVATHPEFPYAILAASTGMSLYSLYDEKIERGAAPPSISSGGAGGVNPLHPVPSLGRVYRVSEHWHATLPSSRPCEGAPRGRPFLHRSDVSFDGLKYPKTVLRFLSFPSAFAPVGRDYVYAPIVDGPSALSVEPVPEGCTWDATGGTFRWRPKVSEMGRRIEVTFLARAGEATLRQRVAITASAELLDGTEGWGRVWMTGGPPSVQLSGNGRWLYGSAPDAPHQAVIVDLAERKTHRVVLEVQRRDVPHGVDADGLVLGDLQDTLFAGIGGQRMSIIDLKTMKAAAPIKMAQGDAFAFAGAPGGKVLLAHFQDPRKERGERAVYGRLDAGGRFSRIKEIETVENLARVFAMQPDPKEEFLLTQNGIGRMRAGKAPAKELQGFGVSGPSEWLQDAPVYGFSHDGQHVAVGGRILKRDLKTVAAEHSGFLQMDRTRDRYVVFSDKSLRVFMLAKKEPEVTLMMDKIVIPSYRSARFAGLFLSGVPNALIVVTDMGVALVPLE